MLLEPCNFKNALFIRAFIYCFQCLISGLSHFFPYAVGQINSNYDMIFTDKFLTFTNRICTMCPLHFKMIKLEGSLDLRGCVTISHQTCGSKPMGLFLEVLWIMWPALLVWASMARGVWFSLALFSGLLIGLRASRVTGLTWAHVIIQQTCLALFTGGVFRSPKEQASVHKYFSNLSFRHICPCLIDQSRSHGQAQISRGGGIDCISC